MATTIPKDPAALPNPNDADPNQDPFADLGGGVYQNGGWLPPGHPDILPQPPGYQAPTGSLPVDTSGSAGNADDRTKVGDVNALTLPIDQTRTEPTAPAAPTLPATGPSNDPMDMITRSAQMRGNAVRPEDVTYWMGKWNETGQNPDYFWSLLMRPEGAPAGSAPSMSSIPASVSAAALQSAMTPTAAPEQWPGQAQGAANPNEDPFDSMGGGVYKDGGWLPPGYPGTEGLPTGPQGASSVTSGASTPAAVGTAAPGEQWPGQSKGFANPNVDPFAEIGGGVYSPATGGWTPKNYNEGAGGATTGGTTTGGTLKGDTIDGGSTGTTTNGKNDNSPAGIDDSYRQALADLLAEKEQTPEELAASPENRAYKLGSQRAEERQRGQLAEQAFTEGTDQSGGFSADLAGLRQQRGEGEAAFLGNLSLSEKQAHSQRLQFAISEAQQAGQFDKAQALQTQLADLDAAIRRESIAASERTAAAGNATSRYGIDVGAGTSAADQALREKLGMGALDIQRLAQELQNQQFGQSLGYNYTDLQERANQFAADLLFRSSQKQA